MFWYKIAFHWSVESTDTQYLDKVVEKLKSPWYTAFSCIYGRPTNNFDGYVHTTQITDNQCTICSYIPHSEKVETLKIQYPESWEHEQETRIRNALYRYIETLSHWEGESKVAWLTIRNLEIQEI